MRAAAGRGEGRREPGEDLLFRLTETLCGLSCMEDQAGRAFFASVLSDHLELRVELRGTKRREDVIALVRAALGVPSGERQLVTVVRVFEGESIATGIEHLLVEAGTTHPPPAPPGPLTTRDLRSALALLEAVEEQLPGTGLGRWRFPWTTSIPIGTSTNPSLPNGSTPTRPPPGRRRSTTHWAFSAGGRPAKSTKPGDPATALDGYAEDLARDPADPQALSGWIVARAVLDPGRSTRRPLARPELLRPRPGG
ncbi:hypothetical protein GCM10022384_30310 [Streptomyces marokkonensis]|uniref:Effector-associated domain-containing protein n=1 Tax=Streptomyces marokkonensis TaxID=324855 RepID=A0ABP7Q8Z1_9ACTN